MKKIFLTIMLLIALFAITSCSFLPNFNQNAEPAPIVVTISEDGYVIVNGIKTDVQAKTDDVITVDNDGYLVVNGVRTDYKTYTQDDITVNDDGFIVVNGVVTEHEVKQEDTIYVDEDGFLIVNGVKTDYRVEQDDEDDVKPEPEPEPEPDPDPNPDPKPEPDPDPDPEPEPEPEPTPNPSPEDTLVIGTDSFPNSLNPFYTDDENNTIISTIQLPLITFDKNGNVAYGKNEACVALDVEIVPVYENDGTTVKETVYRFVLKNDLKFSDGSALTMKDVLFNLYVYLDPVYHGNSTLNAMNIKGLDAYRTQTNNKNVQDSFYAYFNTFANERIYRLLEVLNCIYEENARYYLSMEQMESELTKYMNEFSEFDPNYSTTLDDYYLAQSYFLEELKTDYFYCKGTAADIGFTDTQGNRVTLTTDTEAFLYYEGFIHWNTDRYRFEYALGEQSKDWSEEDAISALFQAYFPNRVNEVILYWNTSNKLLNQFELMEMQSYFESIAESDKITSISGIRYANRTEAVTINGITYGIPTLDAATGAILSGNEVLEITIENVDPSAIFNFAFNVAPMFYYSNDEEIAKFDYVSNFGVKFGNVEFMQKVINAPEKRDLSIGAGSYKIKQTFKNNILYLERNDYFMFPVNTKYVNYMLVSNNLMLDALYAGAIHIAEPTCKQEIISDLNNIGHNGFEGIAVMTNGFGYIGINAEKVPCLEVRQAIMHAINAHYAVDYYMGYSSPIYRPMTKASWAYPNETDSLGQYYAFDDTGMICEQLVIAAGYTKNSKGIYEKGGDVLKYTFTIAGDTTDHPAYQSLKIAAEILNNHGFDITVKVDRYALIKLNTGSLDVWAAEFNSAIDPDLFENYHIESTSSITNAWGYRAIKKNPGAKYDRELELLSILSQIIDEAKETLDYEIRAAYYADALDLIMELAIILPTYQRSDLYVYNANVVDGTSLTPAQELTPYNNPINKLWEIKLINN